MSPSSTFKPAKDKRKKSVARHVTVSPEMRKAYEEKMRSLDQRREDTKHLPEDLKGKR